MNHEEARRLAEERANAKALAEYVTTVASSFEAPGVLARALLEALERIEELEGALELTRMSVELIMARPGCSLEMDRDAKLSALAEIDAALSGNPDVEGGKE